MYVDMPVGTGWSYGEKANQSLEEVGDDFLTFLLNFYKEFPQYRSREIMLTGESFGGKYLSYMSKSILDFNSANKVKINLKSLVVSNPLVDVPTERMHQHELGYTLGLYDDSQSSQVETLRRHCEESPGLNDSAA